MMRCSTWLAVFFALLVHGGEAASPVAGLDHIPVAVKDLQAAAAQYAALGFILKPGRFHADGITNKHVKFPDGTEIELITAPQENDAITSEYRAMLSAGDGPAFFALYAPDMDAVAAALSRSETAFSRDGGFIGFDKTSPLHALFFAGRNKSPTDRPEIFQHPNTAQSLIAIWLAGNDFKSYLQVFATLGVPVSRERACTPQCATAAVAKVPGGKILLLPGSRQRIPGRIVIGATIRVRDLNAIRGEIRRLGLKSASEIHDANGDSFIIPPALTHGLWLEMRQPR
jgi:catechol 2,3-dioxygenase-like lactoylglutathione lyase family enzyme